MAEKQPDIDDTINRATQPSCQKFKGIPLLSISFYIDIVWLLISYGALNYCFNHHDNMTPFMLFFAAMGIVVCLLLLNRHMNYFVLTDEYLIVKNWFIFWKNVSYSLSDVKDVYMHQAGNRDKLSSRSIDITYSETGLSKNYEAGSLLGLDWINLQKALDAKGISTAAEKGLFE